MMGADAIAKRILQNQTKILYSRELKAEKNSLSRLFRDESRNDAATAEINRMYRIIIRLNIVFSP